MSEPFVAEIRIFPFNYAPSGWAFCDGQLVAVSQNSGLFALIGNNFGGDAKSTFGLPDLRGRAPMHHGQGPGLSARDLGESGGAETVTLLQSEIPAHTHGGRATARPANSRDPEGRSLARSVGALAWSQPSASANATLDPSSMTTAGASQPHNNMQPYLVVNFCIALWGSYPQRS